MKNVINIYTTEEYYLRIVECADEKSAISFLKRIESRDWKTHAISTWDDIEIHKSMDVWLCDGNTSGEYYRSYSCQIEFENMEDSIAFKLRWA